MRFIFSCFSIDREVWVFFVEFRKVNVIYKEIFFEVNWCSVLFFVMKDELFINKLLIKINKL